MSTGKLYMIPVTLGGELIDEVIPAFVQQVAKDLRFFAVEEVKTARRFLRKLDREFPIDDSRFIMVNKKTAKHELMPIIRALESGVDVGVMSEAGCPGIADPGSELVAFAHEHGIRIQPLVGPSSILLTLMGSGFSGQEFSFHGYLAKDRKDRIRQLKDFEGDTRRNGRTHLFMDTPFRNMHVLEDLLNELADDTQICIASNLTLPDENIRTMSAKLWREHAYDLAKKPTMFAIGRG